MPVGRPSKGKRPEGANVGDGPAWRNPAGHLRKLLHLENNLPIFEELRNNIRLIGKEFLDINETPMRQGTALKKVMKELVERYPDLFEVEDKDRRLDLAIRMVRVMHTNARGKLRNQNAPVNDGKSRRTSRRLSARPSASAATQVKAEKTPANADQDQRPGYRDYIVPTNFSEPSSSSQFNSQDSVSQWRPATPMPMRRHSTPCASGPSNAARSSQIMAPLTPGPSQSQSPTTPGTNTPNTPRALPESREEELNNGEQQPRQTSHYRSVPPSPRVFRGNELEDIDAVFNFLENCTPSMVHLFEGFVDYGCHNEEFLVAISSWPPGLISNFVRKVALKCGEYVSDMEVDVLQARFMTYFNTR